MRNKRILVLFLLMWLMAVQAHAAHYWVDGTNGNNANGCNNSSSPLTSTAKRTIAGGKACLSSGDTLSIRVGTYAEDIDFSNLPSGSGSFAGATIIESYSTELVTVQGRLNLGVDGSTHNWVIIRGSRVKGSTLTFDGQDNIDGVVSIGGGGGSGSALISNIRLDGIEVKNAYRGGSVIYIGPTDESTHNVNNCNGCEIINSFVHDNGSPASLPVCASVGCQGHYYHGIYVTGSSILIDKTEIYNISGFGIHNFESFYRPANNTYSNNYIHNTGTWIDFTPGGTSPQASAILAMSGDGHTIFNNLIVDNQNGLAIISNNNIVYSNTVYGNGVNQVCDSGGNNWCEAAIAVNGSSTGNVLRNNLIYNNTIDGYGVAGDQAIGSISPNTQSNSFCSSGCAQSGDPLLVNPSGNDFSLQPTSSAIDNGTSTINSSITLSCAGNCDIGVYEVPKFSACTAANNTLSIVFDNPRFPPITNLATTGISLTVDGTSRSLTSPVLNGTNQVDFTFSGAAAKSSASSTGSSVALTDSANIGSSTSNVQKVKNWSSTSCTVTGGGGGIVLTQTHFRFHDLPGTEASPRCLSASGSCSSQEDVNYSVQRGGCFRLRLKMACTGGDCAAGGFICRYSKNAGGYSVVPDSFDSNNIRLYGTGVNPEVPNQGTQTTELLTSSHATNVAGAIIRTSVAIPNIDLSQNSESELEYVMCIDSDESVGTTYDFRLYNQNGTALDTYSVTPRATVVLPRMKGHGLAL